ncbi:MAG: hypothetical protein OJF60_000042 [Burkholderiaceae bacterium]|jgi:hypothetical protein|nr:MAG: hypothetical protein OJF60_000042 [Burkholderiaceae bacterium]
MSSIDPLTVNLDAATIQAAETLSAAAYDPLGAPGQSIADLIADGWTEVPVSDRYSTVSNDNYQGIAFYKTINGVTQVIIANRGTTGFADAASDFDVALGITAPSDQDAEAYYNYVVGWVKGNVSANINVIETGHSLGGQEADYVVAHGTNLAPTEAVTFNGAGINAGVAAGATNHNAVNIVNAGEGVHIAGTYDGNLVTVNGPSVTVGGSVAAAATEGFALAGLLGAAAGTIIGLYESAFNYNHKIQRITDYLRSDPALGGVDLQSYAPDQLNQSIVDFLANLSPSQYYGMTPSQKAALYSSLFNPGGSAGSPPPSNSGTVAETFTASGDSTGQTLTGSMGHVITTAFTGTNGTISNNDGFQETLNFSADGSAVTSDTWSNASGAKGIDTYNPDGSSTSKVTYESGAYATVVDDGQGNITTDYFTQSGQETRSTWVHSDGSSGSVAQFNDGLTEEPGGGPLSVPQSGAYILQNPDGSYSTDEYNASNVGTTNNFAAGGSQTSQSSSSGSGVNDLTVARTTQSYSGGSEYTNQYNSAGAFIGDTWVNANPDGSPNGAAVYVGWAQADCTSGSEVLNASGVYVKNDTAVDGSTYRQTAELNGTTVSHYSAQGVLLSDKWSDTDGSSTTPSVTGSDSFNADGSGSGTFSDTRDGTTGTVTLNGQGSIVVVNTNAGGTVTSEDIWNGDGTYEVAMLNADGSTQATYDYLANGDVTVTDLAPGGTAIADQQTVAAGLVIDPDGASFSKVANADGSYNVYYQDAQGDTTAFQYGASGQLTGSYHTTSDGVQEGDWSGTLPNGTVWTGTINDYTPTYTDAQGEEAVIDRSGSMLVPRLPAADPRWRPRVRGQVRSSWRMPATVPAATHRARTRP